MMVDKLVAYLLIFLFYAIFLLLSGLSYAARTRKTKRFFGYRTPLSLESESQWMYANLLAAKLSLWLAHIFIALSFVLLYFMGNSMNIGTFVLLLSFIQLILFLFLIFSIERKLKQRKSENKQ